MHGYNGKDLARAFRTVRANTIQIAEDIPEEKYGFRVAEGTRSVAETLAHLATGTGWSQEMHGQRLAAVEFGLFMAAAPGCLMLLGTANPDKGITEIWHRPGFDIDEDALPVGVEVMSLAALDLLQ